MSMDCWELVIFRHVKVVQKDTGPNKECICGAQKNVCIISYTINNFIEWETKHVWETEWAKNHLLS